MNAVHYSIYREEVWSNKLVYKQVKFFYRFVSKYLLPPKYWKKVYKRYIQNTNGMQDIFYAKEASLSISVAHHIFGWFSAGYIGFFSFVFLGLGQRWLGALNKMQILVLIFIPIAIGYIPIYKCVFKNDRYLKFFKQFEKKDAKWHKKWKWITIAYCIGGVATSVVGFFIMALLTSI